MVLSSSSFVALSWRLTSIVYVIARVSVVVNTIVVFIDFYVMMTTCSISISIINRHYHL